MKTTSEEVNSYKLLHISIGEHRVMRIRAWCALILGREHVVPCNNETTSVANMI